MKQLLAFLTIGLGLAYSQSTPAFGIFQGTDAVASSGHPCTGPQNVGSQYSQIVSGGLTYICQQTGDPSSLGSGAFSWVIFVSSATASGGGSLVIASGKTFTVNNTLTLAGTDSTTMTFPSTSGTVVTLAATQTLTNKTLTAPTLTTPALGVATATSINKVAITAPATSATLTIADGKTLTASNSLTLAGTDSTTMTFPGTSDTVVTLGATQTLTAKTLTAPQMTAATTTGINYIATESGSNNAIAGTMTNPPALTAGMVVYVKLAHTLQAGANTFAYNGGGALNIKSHNNTANDIGTAYSSGGIVALAYDGTLWEDLSQ